MRATVGQAPAPACEQTGASGEIPEQAEQVFNGGRSEAGGLGGKLDLPGTPAPQRCSRST